MPLNRPFALSTGLAAGVIAAVACYTAAAGAGASAHQTSRSQGVPAAEVVTSQPSVSLAPCVLPAELEEGACVTHKVVTKVVPVPSRAAAATVQGSTGHSELRTGSSKTPAAPSAARDDEYSDEPHESEDSTEADQESDYTNQHEDQDHADHADPEGPDEP